MQSSLFWSGFVHHSEGHDVGGLARSAVHVHVLFNNNYGNYTQRIALDLKEHLQH